MPLFWESEILFETHAAVLVETLSNSSVDSSVLGVLFEEIKTLSSPDFQYLMYPECENVIALLVTGDIPDTSD
jgi:hypothetical protein